MILLLYISTGGRGPSKLTVAIIVLLAISVLICAIWWCAYPISIDHGTVLPVSDCLQGNSLCTHTSRGSMDYHFKGMVLYNNTQLQYAWYRHKL